MQSRSILSQTKIGNVRFRPNYVCFRVESGHKSAPLKESAYSQKQTLNVHSKCAMQARREPRFTYTFGSPNVVEYVHRTPMNETHSAERYVRKTLCTAERG